MNVVFFMIFFVVRKFNFSVFQLKKIDPIATFSG